MEVSPQKINEYQIPLGEIIAAIQARNIRKTAGSFESYTSERNLVTLAQFKRPLEVRNVVVRSTFEWPLIKIKDLAVVKEDFEEARTWRGFSADQKKKNVPCSNPEPERDEGEQFFKPFPFHQDHDQQDKKRDV